MTTRLANIATRQRSSRFTTILFTAVLGVAAMVSVSSAQTITHSLVAASK